MLAEMDTTSEQYFDCLCRTCMHELAEASSNDSNAKPEQEWQSIFDTIEECYSLCIAELLSSSMPQIEVQLNDDMPTKICRECLQQLLSAYRFQQMCIQSDQQLRELIAKRKAEMTITETSVDDGINAHDFLKQEPLLKAREQRTEIRCANISADGSGYVKSEPYDDYEEHYYEPNLECSGGETLLSTVTVKNEPIIITKEEEQVSFSNLNHDSSNHIDDKPFECACCPLTFRYSSDLSKHKVVHEGNRRHICDVCGSAFAQPYQLKNHKKYHIGERPYKCEHCEMRFFRRDHQRRHMRTHTGEKPYKCKYCDRAFAQSSGHIKHLRTHIGEKIYRCELCPLAFRFASEMRLHMATHTNDDDETRERNMKALIALETRLKLKFAKEESE